VQSEGEFILCVFCVPVSPLHKLVIVELDFGDKNMQEEWGTARYHGNYNPNSAFELELQWMVATGCVLGELVRNKQMRKKIEDRNNGHIQLMAFRGVQKKCRLSDWLAISASQSESLDFFILHEQA